MTNQDNRSKKLHAMYFPQKEKENEKPIHETPIVRITGEAYKKLNLYSRIVSEIAGKDIECGGMMLNYRGRNDGVIRDIYLQYQRVSSGDGDLMDNPRVDNDYAQQRGMSFAGMWHSHGHNGVFHSKFDDNRVKDLHEMINKQQRLCMLKSNSKHHHQRKTVNGNKLILEYDRQPLSFVINFDSNEAAKAAAASIELHDEVFYTPSLVINKDEYLNGGPGREYYAEFLVGDGRNPDVKVTYAKLEIIKENNNITPTLEEMVLEVGEKVKYATGSRKNDPGIKLKNFRNYNSVLEKYKNLGMAENFGKNVERIEPVINNEKNLEDSDKNVKLVEQLVNDEKKQEDNNLQTRSQEQKDSNEKESENPNLQTIVQEEPVKQEVEHNQELYRTKTYMGRLEEFYDSLNSRNDSTDKTLAELCRTYSGKQYRFWNDRFEKGNAILKELKKKYLTPEQKNTLENIKKIISSNKYLKRKHPMIYQDLKRRLDSNSSDFYCNPNYLKESIRFKEKEDNYKSLEEKVQNTNNQTTSLNDTVQPKRTFGSYLKSIAKYVGIAALATAMVILPAKYCSKSHYNNKPSAVYTVKKGDSLWNLSKDCLKKKGISVDNNLVYKVVDKVALENGKGKQADYKIGQKDKKNPHLIKPGDKIKFSKKIMDNLKGGWKK